VQRVRGKLFAGSGLALDQYGGIDCGNSGDDTERLPKRREG
jgi:hypothetical protein